MSDAPRSGRPRFFEPYPFHFQKEPDELPTAEDLYVEPEPLEADVVGRRIGRGDPRLRSPELIPRHLTRMEDLRAWERANIAEAVLWTRDVRVDPLSSGSIRELHRRMFDQTWKWAGEFRESEPGTMGGVSKVQEEVARVIWSGAGWFDRKSIPGRDALLRMHHMLVKIRAFRGGNGRHARLWCDWVAATRGLETVEWMGDRDVPIEVIRQRYREALRIADEGDYEALNKLYGHFRLPPIGGWEAVGRNEGGDAGAGPAGDSDEGGGGGFSADA